MVHAGPNNRKSQSDIHPFHRVPFLFFLIVYKSDDLEWNVALIVIHGNYHIVPAPPGF